MRTKTFYLLTLLIFCTKIYAQNNPNEIKSFRNAEYVELNPSQEIAFEKYINQLNKDKIYRTVTDEICNKYKKHILDFDNEENADYPLQIVYKKTINFNDNFLVKFELDNCLGGSAYYRDFAFFTSNNNEIVYNKSLTNDLKEKFYQFVTTKFKDEDRNCYKNNYNYIFTDGLNITDIKNNIVYGSYVLYGENAPNCCPEYNGEFEYNLETRKIQFLNEQHKSSFQADDEISDDEIQILDWTPPPFEENVKLEKEPILFKNTNIKLTNEQKEALKQFIAICKINVNIEDSWNPKNSYLIMNALGIKETTVPREKIKAQLDKVLLDESLRGVFLHNISKMSGGNEEYTYFFIKSLNVPNIVSMKVKDIDVLSKFINNNYKYIKETPIHSNSDTQKENSIVFKAVEKKAVFKGGNSKLREYIFQNLNVPESVDSFSGRVIVNFVITQDGSIEDITVKPNVPIELETEIIRVFKNMPKWIPAQSDGKNLRMRNTFPIYFQGNN